LLWVVFDIGCHDPKRSCRDEVAAQRWTSALETCERQLRSRGDPAAALGAANAAFYLGRYADTTRLVLPLLAGEHAADAHALLGGTQMRTEQYDRAAFHLGVALTLHAAAGTWFAVARDAHQIAGIRFHNGAYRSALGALDVSYDAASRAGDQPMMFLVEVARADFLRAVGAHQAAETALERALARSRDRSESVLVRLKQGLVYIDAGNWALARSPLQGALADELAGERRSDILPALHLNLAYIDRKSSAFDAAMGHLQAARTLAPDDPFSFHMNLGLVLRDSGRSLEAEREMAAAEATGPRGQWSWWVPYNRGLAAVNRGDPSAAAGFFRTAIERVGELASQAGAWGPSLVASLRQPHLALIALHAKNAEWNAVLEIVAAMDGQALLDSTLAPVDQALDVVESPRARPLKPAPWRADQLLAAWRGRSLVVIVPGGDQLWRLEIRNGTIRGSAIGEEAALATVAGDIQKDVTGDVQNDPASISRARQFEAAVLPSNLGEGERIDILLIGRIAKVPLAAIPTRAQLVRVLGVVPRSPVDRPSAGARIAIGNPTGDLRASETEATAVAERLHGVAKIGAAATGSVVEHARGADLLHVAAHTAMQLEGAVLRLHDRDVSAVEISELRPAPRLVVLASCGGATGLDDAGNGSIAAAFLDAGADTVIAARWSVDDARASQFVTAFYDHGGDRDPVFALAAAQRALARERTAQTWAAFEVIAARPTAR
jgi:tetratricopeptide (TPR) repeat protein